MTLPSRKLTISIFYFCFSLRRLDIETTVLAFYPNASAVNIPKANLRKTLLHCDQFKFPEQLDRQIILPKKSVRFSVFSSCILIDNLRRKLPCVYIVSSFAAPFLNCSNHEEAYRTKTCEILSISCICTIIRK